MSKKGTSKKVLTIAASVALISNVLVAPLSVYAAEAQAQPDVKVAATQSEEATNDLSTYFSDEQIKALEEAGEKNAASGAAESRAASYDKSITSLTLQYNESKKNSHTGTFKLNPNAKSDYDGVLTVKSHVKLKGKLEGSNLLLPNTNEFMTDWQNGNYGGRVVYSFPEGVDARAMFNTVDWSKATATDEFTARILGVNTLVWDLKWPIKFNPETVMYDSAHPNEFSILVHGKKKSEMSEAEWNSYDPISTGAALAAAGTAHIGDMTGSADLAVDFDMSKYTGNLDDTTKDKILTAGKLAPSKTRKFNVDGYFLDRSALVAGTEGKKNIVKSQIKTGMDHANPYKMSVSPETWDSYLSVWDTKGKYNTNLLENNEVADEFGALPGKSIFDRDLVLTDGDNFNDFASNRFDRVINYFTHEDITAGKIGEVNTTTVTHNPEKITTGEKTKVTYDGSVTYVDGSTRSLISNVINVSNDESTVEKGQITSANYTIGDKDITGTFTGEIASGQLYINGTAVGTRGGSYSDGQITHYAFGAINESNKDNVYLAALDSNGKEIDRKKVNVTSKPAESQGTIKIDADKYELGNTNLTGTFTGDVKSADLYVNGVYQYSGGSFDSNPFSFYLKSGLNLKAGDVVELRAYDAAYGASPRKELDKDSFTIAQAATQGTITPAKYTIGDAYITGTYTGDVKQADLIIDGVNINYSGGEFKDGKFSFYVGNKIKANNEVKLAAFDAVKPAPRKQLDVKPVQIATVATQGTVKLNPYTEGDAYITGSYTGDVEQFHLVLDGVDKTYGGTKNESNHTFSYYVGSSTIKAGSKVTIQAYDSTVYSQMKYLDEDTVVAKSAVDTSGEFTSVEFDGKNHIKGTFTGTAMKVAYITINGDWLPGATAETWGGTFDSTTGTFEYYVPSNTLQKGDVVKIYGYTKGDVGHHFVNSKEFTVR